MCEQLKILKTESKCEG